MAGSEVMWSMQHQQNRSTRGGGYGSVATHEHCVNMPAPQQLRPLHQSRHEDEDEITVRRNRRITLAFSVAALVLIVVGIAANSRVKMETSNPYTDGPSILSADGVEGASASPDEALATDLLQGVNPVLDQPAADAVEEPTHRMTKHFRTHTLPTLTQRKGAEDNEAVEGEEEEPLPELVEEPEEAPKERSTDKAKSAKKANAARLARTRGIM